MKMKTLDDLLAHELKDLYSAEKQITKALPKMIKAATSEDLQDALQNHLEETEQQISRLEKIFKKLDLPSRGPKCKAMEGLVAEGKEVMEEDGEPAVIDAALIGAAQRVEHYEMAGYGVVRTFASLLGENAAVATLQRTLDEEGAADKKLPGHAESIINIEASEANGNGASKAKAKKTNRRG